MADTKPSEKDILAQNEKLTAEATAANQRGATLEVANATLTQERDQARAALRVANENCAAKDTEIAALKKERDDAKAESARLTESQKDFEGKVAKAAAEQVQQHGINPQAAKQPKPSKEAPAADGKISDWTAACQEHIAANGKPILDREK